LASRARVPSPLFYEAPAIRQCGAYAVIIDDFGSVLVVRTPNGRRYLPGGRIEDGEFPEQALVREIAEECGWTAAVGTRLCQQGQSIFGGRVALDARYWRAALGERLDVQAEHDLLWLKPEEALATLHRASDRAALVMARTGTQK